MEQSTVCLRVEADFAQMKDEARFYYYDSECHGDNGHNIGYDGNSDSAHRRAYRQGGTCNGGAWKQIGITQKLYFKLDHFTGCRFGLFVYATKETGGQAGFAAFRYDMAAE